MMYALREFLWRISLIEGAWYLVATMDRMVVPMIWNGIVFETRLEVVDHRAIHRVLSLAPTEYRAYEIETPTQPIYNKRLLEYWQQKYGRNAA